MDLKARFQQIYANLPLAAREEIIVVLNNEPLTWKVVKLEVDEDTEKGKEVLNILERLGILR